MSLRNPVRQRILAFATEKFLREGFTKVTIEEIASELAISKKTFYKFFSDKDDLLDHVMEGVLARVRTKFARILGSETNFIEKLSATMLFLAQEVSRFGRPMQVDLQRHAPEIWRRMETFRRQRITHHLSRLLDQGMKEGLVRSEINQRLFLLSYLGAVERIVQPSVLIEESFSAREALQGIMRVFFHGILTSEASRKLQHVQQHELSHLS